MIYIKNKDEIDRLRTSNAYVAEILNELKGRITSGCTTDSLDRLAEELARKKGGVPAFKGYRGFPKSICISINEEVVHGIPSQRELKEGDIVSLDFGLYYDGFYGDAAITVGVGKIGENAQKLIDATRKSLYLAIAQAVKGNHLFDISHAIENHVESLGFSVVRQFVGHGIGRDLHEDPQVPNYGKPGHGVRLADGMVLAIEPMINEGTFEVLIKDDGWTAVTKDGKLSAHYEHTVAIVNGNPVILSEI